jgi:hypothetical protein
MKTVLLNTQQGVILSSQELKIFKVCAVSTDENDKQHFIPAEGSCKGWIFIEHINLNLEDTDLKLEHKEHIPTFQKAKDPSNFNNNVYSEANNPVARFTIGDDSKKTGDF